MALVLIAACSMSAFAAVYFTRQITNQLTIKSAWNIALFRWDTQTFITAIDWGSLDPGIQISTNQLFSGTCLKIKNNGNAEVFVAWKLDPATPLPTGVVLTARYEYASGSMANLPQNDYSQIDIGAGQFSGGTGGSPGRIEFDLSIDQFASPGSATFIIDLLAADSSSG